MVLQNGRQNYQMAQNFHSYINASEKCKDTQIKHATRTFLQLDYKHPKNGNNLHLCQLLSTMMHVSTVEYYYEIKIIN